MAKDKFAAVWVSHSSINSFLRCPRAYYLKNIYRDPDTGHKISLISPPLALGQVVHRVLESLSVLPVDQRFRQPLMDKFETAWKKISGKKGGFFDPKTEQAYKNRGKKMIRRVVKNPGPIKKLAVKIKMDLPYFWFSEKDNIILCGQIDWLEYLPESDAVQIIDFKTGKRDEDPDSLQLPIYHLLVYNCQNRKVAGSSYWYLERNSKPTEVPLPDLEEAHQRVLKVAKEIKLARQLERFVCPNGDQGCPTCRPMEAIFHGEGELVDVNEFKHDVYVLNKTLDQDQGKSEIL